MASAWIAAMIASGVILASVAAASASVVGPVRIHFEIPTVTVIPALATFRASCDLWAEGEEAVLLSGAVGRVDLGAQPGNCTMVLNILGLDVVIPTITTTPLGRSSFVFPIPLADVSVDLETALDSNTIVAPADVAYVTPSEIPWPSWGVQRLAVTGAAGEGELLRGELNTTFTYSVRLGLTVAFFGAEVYHADLSSLGAYRGTPSLETDVVVDLVPHVLSLGTPEDVTHANATLTWSGTVDADVDHLELWVVGGGWNVSYRVDDPAVQRLTISVVPSTAYRVWLRAVDGSGQASTSAAGDFVSASAPPPDDGNADGGNGLSPASGDALTIALVALAVLAALVGYGVGLLRGRRRD